MNDNNSHQSINQILDQELTKIDAQTLDRLRTIRREIIEPAHVAATNQHQMGNVMSLSLHPVWRHKKWVFMSLVFAVCISVMVIQIIKKPVPLIEEHLEFSMYTEVDPDWLIDMEIAETFGDE